MADKSGGWAAWGRVLAPRSRDVGGIRWPEARLGGDLGRGRRLLAGRLRVGEDLYEAPGVSVWDIGPEDPAAAGLHAMAWLDDLAALGTPEARRLGQSWVAEWIDRFGDGTGPGWNPELTGWRLLRLLGHGRFLLHGGRISEERLTGAVAAQGRFLERRWKNAGPGEGRIAALVALLSAELAQEKDRAGAGRWLRTLSEETGRTVDGEGAIASRSPEELLVIATLCEEANEALRAAELPPDPGLLGVVARAAVTLRTLRHADGGLARFHGGGRGPEGTVDRVLALARRRVLGGRSVGAVRQMGFLRLAAGRTTVIVDAAPPPMGAGSGLAHASTLAFEMTSGRRPLVVSVGPGQDYGPRWRRATRATASHSTLALEEVSSARLGPSASEGGSEPLVEGPTKVIVESPAPGPEGTRVELAHDGWRAGFGLTHARTLTLSPDGRRLSGEDVLTTLTRADAATFDRMLGSGNGLGIPFALRFHLHPDVEAQPASDGSIVLFLRSGEEWAFWPEEGGAELRIEASVWLEPGRLRPRPSLQIAWVGRALRPVTRLRWTLAKGYGTPEGLRDLEPPPSGEEDEE